MNFYSHLLQQIVLPIGDFLSGSSVMKILHEWKEVSNLSEEDLSKLSQEKLRRVLTHTVANIPYYREKIVDKNEDPAQWIKSFPIMRKRNIQVHIQQMTSVPASRLIKSETSGSSGERGLIYKSKKDISNGRALILLIWGWAGYSPGMKILQTGITPKRGFVKRAKDILLRTHYYVAFGLAEEEALLLLKQHQGRRNGFLIGYASSLFVLAEVANRHNLNDIHFEKAISLGDKLFSHYRKSIKQAFGCEVVDTYGCSEGFVIATQKDLEYYYILTPHVYLELLDENGVDVPDGEIGHVIVTSLDAYAMPLIRYDTGDLAVRLPRGQYPDKRDLNFPLLERVIGRETDIVKTASGKFMIVHFFTGIFELVPEIRQFRVLQDSLNYINIEYIPAENFKTSVLKNLEAKIHDYLEGDFEIRWKQVTHIPSTKSGKPQIIQSTLKEATNCKNTNTV